MGRRPRPLSLSLPAAVLAPLLVGVGVPACGAVGDPPPPAASIDLAPAWSAGPGTPGGEALPPPPPERWWSSFGEPALDRLVEEALAANHDLVAAAARFSLAAAQARIAGADRRPTVGARGGASRRRANFIGFPIPGSAGQVLSTTTTTLDAGLDVGWELDLWNRLGHRAAAAAADRAAAGADLVAARLSIAAQTVRAWFALREARLQVELAEATLASWRENEVLVAARTRAGLVGPLDLRLVRTGTAGAEAAIAARRQTLQGARRRLELLVARYPAAELEEAGALSALPPPVPAGLPAQLLERRPDLVAARRRVEAAYARARAARRDLLPSLTLTGTLGRTSEQLSDLLDGDFSVWSLGAGLVAPLHQGGRLRAAVAGADARRLEAEALYARDVLAACAQVEDALDAATHQERRVASLVVARDEGLAASALARRQYRGGLEGVITVLEAQRRQFAAESQLLTARRLLLESRVDLHLALGGGFSKPPSPSAAPGGEG